MRQIYDKDSGLPLAMYRDPEDIKEDIRVISERITEINDMLNVRELLSGIFDEDKVKSVSKRAEDIVELLQYASEALEELRSLSAVLDELKLELIDSMNALG